MTGWYIAFFVWIVIVLVIGKPIVDSSIRRQESNRQNNNRKRKAKAKRKADV